MATRMFNPPPRTIIKVQHMRTRMFLDMKDGKRVWVRNEGEATEFASEAAARLAVPTPIGRAEKPAVWCLPRVAKSAVLIAANN